MGVGLRTSVFGLLILAFGTASCARRDTPPTDPALRAVGVPAELVNNLVLVPVRVNGSAPVPFILDTGASTSVVDRADAVSLGLATGEHAQATTGGGSVEATAIRDVTFDIGGVTLRAADAVSIDLSGVEAGLGHRIAGILGSDVFKQRVVEIDYVTPGVRLHDLSGFRYAGPATPMSISVEDGVALARPVFVRPDGSELDAKLEFDTGQSGALTLIRPFVYGADLTVRSQPALNITSGAILAGRVSAYLTRVKAIRLEEWALENLMVNVTPTAADAGVSGETMGIIGGDVLRRFTVFVDYSRSQVFLEPNKYFAEPFEFDMSGISLAAEGSALNVYRVRLVIAGSPASEAGVSAGDVLTMIDGRSAQTMSLSEIRQLFRQRDRELALQITRGQQPLQIRLKTRRLI